MIENVMIISLTDDDGLVQTKAVRLDSVTIEATVPELKKLAKFFSGCVEDLTIKMETSPIFANGNIPGYELTVPEIITVS